MAAEKDVKQKRAYRPPLTPTQQKAVASCIARMWQEAYAQAKRINARSGSKHSVQQLAEELFSEIATTTCEKARGYRDGVVKPITYFSYCIQHSGMRALEAVHPLGRSWVDAQGRPRQGQDTVLPDVYPVGHPEFRPNGPNAWDSVGLADLMDRDGRQVVTDGESRDYAAAWAEALSVLPMRYALAVWLHFVEGLPYREIGPLIGGKFGPPSKERVRQIIEKGLEMLAEHPERLKGIKELVEAHRGGCEA